MPKIVSFEVREQIWDEIKGGLYSNKEIAEMHGVSEEFVSRLKHKQPTEKKETIEGEPDSIAKLIEEKDKRITILEGENFHLREANAHLRRQLAEYEKRLSLPRMFREMALMRMLRDIRG